MTRHKRLAAVTVAGLLLAVSGYAQVPTLKPVLLDIGLPNVPQCEGILDQEIADIVRAATVDPGLTFEQWRRAHRNMMEASPVVECKSKLWQALNSRAGLLNAATVPAGTEGLSLRSADIAAEQFLRDLSASIGGNVDLAGGVQEYQGETAIAVNPNNPQQLVASANSFYRDPSAGCISPTGGTTKTFGTMAMYGSSDGGATWVYRCAPWPASLTGGVAGANQYFGSDPAVAWDAQGRAVTVYMLISAANNGDAGASIVCARSSDVGNSWTYLGTVVNNISNAFQFDDKELVAVDNSPGPASGRSHPGRIYVVWDENNFERVAHSDDGAAWTTVNLPTPNIGDFDIGGDIKVGPDGTVYVIWNRLIYNQFGAQSSEATVFSSSTDGGTTWSAPVTAATEALESFGNNNTPPAQNVRAIDAFASLDIDSNPASAYYGRLYVAFSDFPTGVSSGTNTNTYVTTSSNGGVTWTSRVKANDDLSSATHFFPWLAVDPTDGSVNVSWYDTRADVNNRRTQVYYARSSNGGATFENNLLVMDGGPAWVNHVSYSDESSSDNHNFNANQYGDYSGIVAINRQVHPFWTDSREFYPASGDARLEDAATALIVNCSAPAAVSAPSVVVGGSCSSVIVSWSAPSGWGTNATGGSYSIYRATSPSLTGATLLASNVTKTSYIDKTGSVGTSHYYFVSATNNCPGTALTPMTTSSAASAPIVFPSGSTGPTATVTGSATICIGSMTTISAALTGTGPWNLMWSDGVMQSNVSMSPATRSVSPTGSTTYTVASLTDAHCTGTTSGNAIVKVGCIRAPAVSTIFPAAGALGGGTAITIRGTYFQPGATVTIGGVPVTNVVVVSPARITGTTGAHAKGVVNVKVTNSDGGHSTRTTPFTYTDGVCCNYPSFSTFALSGASAQPPYSVNAGDFNGDGIPDIVAPGNDFNALFVGHGDGTFGPAAQFTAIGNTAATTAVDFDGDGILDADLAQFGGVVTAYIGEAAAPLSTSATAFSSTTTAFALDSGDFNGDGIPDLIVPNHATGQVSICIGAAGGGCTNINTYPIGTKPAGVAIGDFNGDGNLDIAVTDEAAGTVTILLGTGSGGFNVGATMAAGTCTTTVMGVAAADVNGDGILDLVVATGAVLLGNGNGTFHAGTPIPASNGRHVVVADFNGDGKPDVAIDATQFSVNIKLGDGAGGFSSGPTIPVAGGLFDAFATADFDSNGSVDLVIGGPPVVAMNTIQACSTVLSPSSIPNGVMGTAYSNTFTLINGVGTITFSENGALPTGLSFSGATISGTPAQTGSFPITIKASDSNGCSSTTNYTLMILLPANSAPANLVATATSGTQVSLSWTGVSGSFGYAAFRSTLGQGFVLIGSSSTPTFTDATVPGLTYVYRVRTLLGGSMTSADSAPDIATTIFFTDDPVVAGSTGVKAVHLTELRTAVNAVRLAAGLGAFTFTDPNLAGLFIKALHIQQLRSALDPARSAIGVPAISYANSLVAGSTPVRAVDVTELRNGVK